MNTPEEFAKLPFADIYHDSAIVDVTPARKHEITQRKHAEIVVPDMLSLDALRYIYVRSVAEKETLLSLLHEKNLVEYDEMIQIGDEATFFKDRNYVDSVTLMADHVNLSNQVGQSDGYHNNAPFPESWGKTKYAVNPDNTDAYLDFKIELFQINGSEYRIWPKNGDKAVFRPRMNFKIPDDYGDYMVRATLDGHVAYQGSYYRDEVWDADLPF
ncbi:hypothetical protein [Secundilactobacillus muriivasis]